MGLFDFLFDNKKKKETSSFDEYCENCGELLEDCECDDSWLSKQDISQDFGIDELILLDEIDEDFDNDIQ